MQSLFLLNISQSATQVHGSKVVGWAEYDFHGSGFIGTEDLRTRFLPNIKCRCCPGIKILNLRLSFPAQVSFTRVLKNMLPWIIPFHMWSAETDLFLKVINYSRSQIFKWGGWGRRGGCAWGQGLCSFRSSIYWLIPLLVLAPRKWTFNSEFEKINSFVS